MSDYLKEKEMYSETLNVGQLIDILKKYPRDTKVMTTWESTLHDIKAEFIYIASTGTLYIDADEGFYRKDFEKTKD